MDAGQLLLGLLFVGGGVAWAASARALATYRVRQITRGGDAEPSDGEVARAAFLGALIALTGVVILLA